MSKGNFTLFELKKGNWSRSCSLEDFGIYPIELKKAGRLTSSRDRIPQKRKIKEYTWRSHSCQELQSRDSETNSIQHFIWKNAVSSLNTSMKYSNKTLAETPISSRKFYSCEYLNSRSNHHDEHLFNTSSVCKVKSSCIQVGTEDTAKSNETTRGCSCSLSHIDKSNESSEKEKVASQYEASTKSLMRTFLDISAGIEGFAEMQCDSDEISCKNVEPIDIAESSLHVTVENKQDVESDILLRRNSIVSIFPEAKDYTKIFNTNAIIMPVLTKICTPLTCEIRFTETRTTNVKSNGKAEHINPETGKPDCLYRLQAINQKKSEESEQPTTKKDFPFHKEKPDKLPETIPVARPKSKLQGLTLAKPRDNMESFSTFFIINNMDVGNCECVKKSESYDLLSTAMICLHVNKTSNNDRRLMNATTSSSCPAIMSRESTVPGCICNSSQTSKLSEQSYENGESVGINTSLEKKLSCSHLDEKPLCLYSQNAQSCPEFPQSIPCPNLLQTSSSTRRKEEKRDESNNTDVRRISVGLNCTLLTEKSLPREEHVLQCKPTCPTLNQPQTTSVNKSPETSSKETSCSGLKTLVQVSTQYSSDKTTKVQRVSVHAITPQKCVSVQPSVSDRAPPPQRSVQATPSQKSTAVQVSVLKTNISRSSAGLIPIKRKISIVCPSQCSSKLPNVKVSSFGKKHIISIHKSVATQLSVANARIGPDRPAASLTKSCNSVKLTSQQVIPILKPGPFKCISTSKMNIPSGKPYPVIDEQPKQDLDEGCAICTELSKLDDCDGDAEKSLSEPPSGPCDHLPTTKTVKQNNKTVIAAKVKKGKNFNEAPRLDVSTAEKFLYSEGNKKDLKLFTGDYGVLMEAFEKFMMDEKAKLPKCKYLKK